MLRMVEEATHAGYPHGCRGRAADRAGRPARSGGGAGGTDPRGVPARAARASSAWRASPQERELLWKGRKNAFGAVGRVSPTYLRAGWRGAAHQDRARPCASSARWRQKYGLTISNIFHAGDGNMHPIILFDARKPGDLEKARAAGEEILIYCIEVGGSITGEHGVGMEKNELMARLFTAGDAGDDPPFEAAVRPREPAEPRQDAAHRPRLRGELAAGLPACPTGRAASTDPRQARRPAVTMCEPRVRASPNSTRREPYPTTLAGAFRRAPRLRPCGRGRLRACRAASCPWPPPART